MSAFTECCVPRRAPSPSGFTFFHSKFCKEHGRQIDPQDQERAAAWVLTQEARKRAEKLARESQHPLAKPTLSVVPPEEYEDYWSDRAFEQEGRR